MIIPPFAKRIAALVTMCCVFIVAHCLAGPQSGVTVRYQLPTDGPLPKTYLVTLAAVDPDHPNWVVSNFASGVPCTVTAENKGQFSGTWNGLDDNMMPVAPGTYAIKGIYAPATLWPIDGQYHALWPKLASMGNSWGESPSEDAQPGKIEGDPVNAPFRDASVTPDGKGVLLFQYLENAANNYQIDFTKPIGYGQIGSGFPSGSAAGGMSVCTDGDTIWSAAAEGGPKFIYRPDGRPFGTQNSAGRHNITLNEGWVTAMAAWKRASGTVVFVGEHGKMVQTGTRRFEESQTEFVDKIVALDGTTAKVLGEWKMEHPLGLAVRDGKLYALHQTGQGCEVETLALDSGWAQGQFAPLFSVPASIHPFDIAVDSRIRIYLSDPDANHVYQFDQKGKLLLTYGKLDVQKGGTYDPLSFMSPQKIASWTDSKGVDHLLVVEQGGANRLSEWDGNGNFIRQWVTPQFGSNEGYAIDPRHPGILYMDGQLNSIVRWKVDYHTGQWTVDAVWENTGEGPFKGRFLRTELAGRPSVLYHGDDLYLAFANAHNPFIEKLEGDHFRACMAILHNRDAKGKVVSSMLWRDVNGNGQVEDDECVPMELPHGTILPRAFGDNWADDFTLLAIGVGTPDIWQLPCNGFDAHGTPIYDPKGWKKLLTDEIFAAKLAGTATTLRGANEVGTVFNSDWSSVVPSGDGGYYVDARSGPNLTANYGTQFKLSRYVPDGKGGLVQSWRVGRIAIQRNALPGEVYGPIFVSPPISGLVGVVDNSRAGVVVYTDDGLYVDTLLPDQKVLSHDQRGAYWNPGEYFAGVIYPNRDNGKVYLALGKTFPVIYDVPAWTPTSSPVHKLDVLDKTVSISSSQISAPTEIAIKVRGGASASKVAFFYPAPGGGPKIDSSMDGGWDACDPIRFSSGGDADQNVEVRCLYDPDHLYLRWHARLGHPFQARPLRPAEHLFAHDRQADTLGLYLQCDPNAAPGGKALAGRSGDVRFVFGLFSDSGTVAPAVLGMYPAWSGPGAVPTTYNTAQTTSFAHVGLVPGVKSAYSVDPDGKGYVLSVAIPRAALPGSPKLDGMKTTGNFDANLGGVNRFWWSNADGSASRETFDEPSEARLFPGCWSPMQFLSMDSLPIRSWVVIGPFGDAKLAVLDHQRDGAAIQKLLWSAVYPPDTARDFTASFQGDLTRTHKADRQLHWKPQTITMEVVDFKAATGWDGFEDSGVMYLCTHVYSPDNETVSLSTNNPHGKIGFRGWLNTQALPADPANPDRIAPGATLSLHAGWNELLFRVNYFYGTGEFGATLTADPAVLWKLRISGEPQPDH